MQQARVAARAIGCASICFALASFLAPGPLARILGYGERRRLVRALGARDLVVGLGLVTAEDLSPWLRARLASEAADTLLHAAGALTGAFDRKRAFGISVLAAAFAAVDSALIVRAANH